MSDRVRVTFEISKSLQDYIDKECEKKSNDAVKITRSTFLRQLIAEARDKNK